MSDGRVRVMVGAEVPNELLAAFMQHVRTFDAEHPGCLFRIVADAPDMRCEELKAVLDGVTPPFAVLEVLEVMEAAKKEIDDVFR